MPNWLHSMKVKEVSFVDKGANPGANIAFWKRDYTPDQRKHLASVGHALPDGSYPIANVSDLRNAVRAIGRASNPATAKAHITERAKALGATSVLPSDWPGSTKTEKRAEIEKGYGETMALAPPDAPEVEAKVFSDFLAEADASDMLDEYCEMICALNDSVRSIIGDADLSEQERKTMMEQTFNEFYQAAVTELGDDVGKRKTPASSAPGTQTAEDVEKGANHMNEVEVLKNKVGELEAALSAATARLNKKGEKEGDACMMDGEEGTMEMEGGKLTCVTKREMAKRNAVSPEVKKRLDDQEATIKKLNDEREHNQAVQAVSIYKRLPLEADKFATIFRKIRGAVTVEEFAEFERVMKAANEAMAKITVPVGSSRGGAGGSAVDQLQGIAKSLREKDKSLSVEKAFSIACEQNPDLYAQQKSERRASN